MEQVYALTLAAVLTGPAIPIVAVIVQQLVDYFKAIIAPREFNGLIATAIATAAIYVFAYVAVGVYTAESLFQAFLVWLGCAMATVGAHRALVSVGAKT